MKMSAPPEGRSKPEPQPRAISGGEASSGDEELDEWAKALLFGEALEEPLGSSASAMMDTVWSGVDLKKVEWSAARAEHGAQIGKLRAELHCQRMEDLASSRDMSTMSAAHRVKANLKALRADQASLQQQDAVALREYAQTRSRRESQVTYPTNTGNDSV